MGVPGERRESWIVKEVEFITSLVCMCIAMHVHCIHCIHVGACKDG